MLNRVPARAVRLLALTVLLLSIRTKVAAHGAPPTATALLAHEAGRATLVRLTRGLAHRAADGFHFVCPETWGGDVTAPVAGLPDGHAAVASDHLYIVDP